MATKKSNNGKRGKVKKAVADTSPRQRVGIGVGLTAAAAAAAGAYFLYGSKNAAKNRKAVRSWALKAKAEVLETLERAQEMSKKEYEQLVDRVGAAYAQLQEVKKTDLAEFKREMKKYWENIAKEAELASKAAAPKSKAKKAPKKAAKKTTKK